MKSQPIEVVAARCVCILPGRRLKDSFWIASDRTGEFKQNRPARIFSSGQFVEADFYSWQALPSDTIVFGPAVIADSQTSVIVDCGWQAVVRSNQQLLLTKTEVTENRDENARRQTAVDPVDLEIFNGHFQSMAEQMGAVLQKTAVSVNVKERLDFSCAVFSDTGDLIANAPHIPVHLGAMSEAIKSTISMNPTINPGDVFVSNDPYAGGSHLPDVTVMTPVFGDETRPDFWVASRAHHAEIGGCSPGSMPANATRLGEEGVLIDNFKIVDRGKEKFDELTDLLNSGPYPSRNPVENVLDIAAQIAANRSGELAMSELIECQSKLRVIAYMKHVHDAAETKTRLALAKIKDGNYQFSDRMDDGAEICLSLRKHASELTVDFSGSSPTHQGNLNANRSIVNSAIMYCLRCIIDEEIPLNSGVLEPVNLILPECFLNPAPRENRFDSPAVVGGNVETSQRIVDTILGALGLAAASQGTMNNFLIGDSKFGYYETLGGGSGATARGPGADAVHCHMSNTRLTDPEIIETRYPMIVRKMAVRSGSGGSGIHPGGNGMIREIEFLAPLTLSLLSSRRTTAPFGLNAGDGQRGRNLLIREGKETIVLPPQCEIQVEKGDRLQIQTPGGGGFGFTE